MNEHEFVLLKPMETALKRWWVIVLLMVAGGAVGWVFSLFHAPVYEATATINTSIEFKNWISSIPDKEQALAFVEGQKDEMYNSAQMLLDSVQVKNEMIDVLKSDGVEFDFFALQNKLSIERKKTQWELRARDADPQLATRIANLWAEKGTTVLQGALQHSIKASVLEAELTSLSSNNTNITPSNLYGNSAEQIQALSDQIMQEKSAAGGVPSFMSFTLEDPAQVPTEPVEFSVVPLVLAGLVVGFLVSLWAVNLPKVFKRG